MYATHLQKVGGSVMLVVPPAILELLDLKPGSKVGIGVDGGRIVVETRKPGYTLDELLAQCDSAAQLAQEDRAWSNDGAVGRELI